MRIHRLAVGICIVAVMSVGLALPAGASTGSQWRPPQVTTQTSTLYCSQAPSEPLTLTTTTKTANLPWAPSSMLTVGLAKVSGGPNGRTLSFLLYYKATPPAPTEPSDDATLYAGWAVIGDAGVLGFDGPIYLEGGTASVNHYGQAAVTRRPVARSMRGSRVPNDCVAHSTPYRRTGGVRAVRVMNLGGVDLSLQGMRGDALPGVVPRLRRKGDARTRIIRQAEGWL